MTKEELIKLSRENLRKSKQGSLCECYDEAFIKVYQLSEKRIAELEAQNKWLEGCKLELGEHLGKANDKIADLEKENAELREKLEIEQIARSDWFGKAVTKDEQLTKAKEYIKLLLMNCVGVYENTRKTIAEIQAEAEQFLNEVEK